METLILPSTQKADPQSIRELHRQIPVNPLKKDWKRLQLEMKVLPEADTQLVMPIRLIARACNNNFGNRAVLEYPPLLDLFKRLLGAFIRSDTFSIIRDRCLFSAGDREMDIVLKNLQPLFGIWIFRHYPQLGYLLLHPNFSEKYTGLLGIPFQQFIRYSPAFVLYRLSAMSEHPVSMIWIRWMARGKNIRKAPGLPVSLSKKEAHYVTQAPVGLTFHAAFFYGLVRAAGGDDKLFRRLFQFYREVPEDQQAMTRILEFLARYRASSTVTSREFQQLMTYIRHHQQEGLPLNLKRRSLPALLRQAMAWEEERQLQARLDLLKKYPMTWEKMLIRDFEQDRGKEKLVIVQLGSHLELVEEGLAMHHCVGSYAYRCAEGTTSIWSLRRVDPEGQFERLVTLEVTGERAIVQASAPYNAGPVEEELNLIRSWAEEANLSIWL